MAPGVTQLEARFHDAAIFPHDNVDEGSSSGVGWMGPPPADKGDGVLIRHVADSPSGRRRFRLLFDRQDAEVVSSTVNFVKARDGSTFGFRLKDWRDFSSHSDGVTITANPADRITIATGNALTTEFRLWKQYLDVQSGRVAARTITRPREGTVRVWLDGVEKTEGTHYEIEYRSGIIIFDTPPDSMVLINVVFQFDVPVRLLKAVDDWMEAIQNGYDDAATQPLAAIEILDHSLEPHPFDFGGFFSKTYGANEHIMIRLSNGAYQELATLNASHQVVLPFIPATKPGGPLVRIKNVGAITMNFYAFAGAQVSVTAAASIFPPPFDTLYAGGLAPGEVGEVFWTGAKWRVVR